MTTLFLVRHGETIWNRFGRWQGHTDVPLSDEGREQARLLAARLKAERQQFDHIYASDLMRAYETAEFVAKALDMPVHPLIELREMHVGDWSGLTNDEIRVRYPEQWTLYDQGEDGPRGGNGETNAALQERVARAIEQLVQDHPGERLLVVTHGGPVRAVLAHIGHHREKFWNIKIGNTSLTEIVWNNGSAHVVRVNDMEHIQAPITAATPSP